MRHKTLLALVASLLLAFGPAHAADQKPAADVKADCEKQAADKKLAGAAKTSFLKKCTGGGEAPKSAAAEACEKQAAEKKLAGAAKNSFVKKCVTDASAAK